METPHALAQLAAPWAHFYSHSKVASTIVSFVHIASVVIGGGLAITLDRATLRHRASDPAERRRHLLELGGAHRVVLASLALSLLSGIALLAADLDTFLGSIAFWIKMALLALLLANGGYMNRLEAIMAHSPADEVAWRRLRPVAVASLVLWLAITFAGVALTSAA